MWNKAQVENHHLDFKQNPSPSTPTQMTPPPSYPPKTCHDDTVVSHAEVKGHKYRVHVLILLGKLGPRPDPGSLIPNPHIEVQVQHRVQVPAVRPFQHRGRQSGICI